MKSNCGHSDCHNSVITAETLSRLLSSLHRDRAGVCHCATSGVLDVKPAASSRTPGDVHAAVCAVQTDTSDVSLCHGFLVYGYAKRPGVQEGR